MVDKNSRDPRIVMEVVSMILPSHILRECQCRGALDNDIYGPNGRDSLYEYWILDVRSENDFPSDESVLSFLRHGDRCTCTAGVESMTNRGSETCSSFRRRNGIVRSPYNSP